MKTSIGNHVVASIQLSISDTNEERCKILNWSSLERRRKFVSLTECRLLDYFEFCKSNKP